MNSVFLKPALMKLKIVRSYSSIIKRIANSTIPKTILLDSDEKFKNITELENNLISRSRPTKIDLHVLKNLCSILKKHACYRYNLKRQKNIIDADILENEVNFHIEPEKAITLNNKKSFNSHQFKTLDRYYENLREFVALNYLSLPNDLHVLTPRSKESSVIYSKVEFSSDGKNIENHLTVGEKLDVVRYLNPVIYFLLKDAAILEIATINFVTDVLQNEMQYKPFLNPDTCTELVMSGTFGDRYDGEAFILENENLHLTGGASLASFCAFRVSQSVHQKFQPERNFSYGRRYVPLTEDFSDDDLYSVCQRTNVQLFITTTTEEQMRNEFENTLEFLKTLYERLNLDFRICYVPASALSATESLKASIQLYSAYKKEFVEVANLAVYDDFISKRLTMLCHDKNSNYSYIRLISGTVISFPTFLAYLLERSTKELNIPKCIQPYMFSKEIKNK